MVAVDNMKLFGTTSAKSDYPNMQTAKQETKKATASQEIAKLDKLMRFTARPFVSSGVELDDLMQVGRMTLLAAYEGWRGEASLWTYAHLMVKRDMERYATSEKKEPSRATPSGATVDCEGAQRPDDALETAQGIAIATLEFSGLKTEERQVLRLRFGGGMDVRSIAEEIGISKSEVDRIYHGAIATLRSRVGAKL